MLPSIPLVPIGGCSATWLTRCCLRAILALNEPDAGRLRAPFDPREGRRSAATARCPFLQRRHAR